MTRTKLALAVLALMLAPASALALTTDSGRTVFIDKSKTTNDVYASAGGTLDLSGTFNDDVLVAGGTVTVNGPVSGDVLVAGGTVKIAGEVKGSVRVVGGTLELNSKVGRNLVLAGGTLTTGPQADISGEVLLLGGTSSIDGRIGKSLEVWTDMLTLNAKVEGNVTVHFSKNRSAPQTQLVLGPSAVVGGNLLYYAAKDAEVRSGASVKGTTTRKDPEVISAFAKTSLAHVLSLVRLWNVFSLLVVAGLMALVFPRSLRKVGETMTSRKGRAIGWGVLIFLASPVAFILLPFTVIGIPLMLILSALYVMALYASQVFLGFAIGSWLLRLVPRTRPWVMLPKTSTGLVATILGIVVISLVFDFLLGGNILPRGFSVLLGLVRFVLILWTFGGLLMTVARNIKEQEQI